MKMSALQYHSKSQYKTRKLNSSYKLQAGRNVKTVNQHKAKLVHQRFVCWLFTLCNKQKLLQGKQLDKLIHLRRFFSGYIMKKKYQMGQ